jgi:hypothetical protein
MLTSRPPKPLEGQLLYGLYDGICCYSDWNMGTDIFKWLYRTDGADIKNGTDVIKWQ